MPDNNVPNQSSSLEYSLWLTLRPIHPDLVARKSRAIDCSIITIVRVSVVAAEMGNIQMIGLQEGINALGKRVSRLSRLSTPKQYGKRESYAPKYAHAFGGGQSMSRRLPNIVQNASSLRGLANQYRDEARLALHKARMARQSGNELDCISFMQAVRAARCKARKCSSFAVLCEKRAEVIDTLTRPVSRKM